MTIVKSVDELLAAKPKVVVEAASQQAAREFVPKIVSSGAEVIVMSTGALLGLDVNWRRVHVPSGAIGGLDALSSASLAGIDEVTLTSRKNPKALGKDNTVEASRLRGICGGGGEAVSAGNECRCNFGVDCQASQSEGASSF